MPLNAVSNLTLRLSLNGRTRVKWMVLLLGTVDRWYPCVRRMTNPPCFLLLLLLDLIRCKALARSALQRSDTCPQCLQLGVTCNRGLALVLRVLCAAIGVGTRKGRLRWTGKVLGPQHRLGLHDIWYFRLGAGYFLLPYLMGNRSRVLQQCFV